MVRRKNTLPKGSFLHRRSGIYRALLNIAHKRRNARFNGLWRVHTPPQPLNAHTAAHTPKHGAFRTGVVSLPSDRSARSQTSPGRVSERRTLPLLGLDQGRSRRTRRACGTAMRSCASLFRGVAAPLGCVIPLLFLSPHRWASQFCSAASLAHRKLSACSLVTAVRFLNRCSRRSMRETYLLEQRSGCRF